jgi:hypothetical protein
MASQPRRTQSTVVKILKKQVRFQVLMAATVQMIVFWIVAPCSLVEVYQGLMMEAASTSETSVNLYQTIRLYTLEDSHVL